MWLRILRQQSCGTHVYVCVSLSPEYRDEFPFLEREDIILGKLVGGGCFGDVHQGAFVHQVQVEAGKYNVSDRLVAVKRLKLESEQDIRQVADEVCKSKSPYHATPAHCLLNVVCVDHTDESGAQQTKTCSTASFWSWHEFGTP